MNPRQASCVATVAAAVVASLGMAPAVHAAGAGHQHLLVRPGQPLQAAVDRAGPGDVIELGSGTYRGSIAITRPGVTIRGTGPRTVIAPDTGTATRRADATTADDACAKAGHGVCVTGTAEQHVSDVRLSSLTVSGFALDGINASHADRLHVEDVVVRGNGRQGISQEKSVQSMFRDNTVENNGQSGIFVANTVAEEGGALDTRGTVVTGNRLTGNRYGVTLRRVQGVTVADNEVTGNCGGIFVVGDENKPRGGSSTVMGNQVRANNKYCPASARLPFVQGTGILLTGVERTLVTGNQVEDNTGTSPLSGGIVLARSMVGVHNDRNSVVANTVQGNGPADIADRDSGTGNAVTGNSCRVAEPATATWCG